MKFLVICGLALLGFAQAVGAQTVHLLQGKLLVPVQCDRLNARFGSLPSLTVCYEPGSGPRLRCEDVTAEQSARLCEKVGREGSGGVSGRLAVLAQDIVSGFARPGGRRAGTDTCPAGMPEGEVLADTSKLIIAAKGVDEFVLVDERGRLVAKGDRVQVDSSLLRGAQWELRGRASGRSFVCRFSVLPVDEARALIQEVSALPTSTRAGLLERADLFRRQSLWYEYWSTIEALRGD